MSAAAYAPALDTNGVLRIIGKKSFIQTSQEAPTQAIRFQTSGSMGTQYGEGTWNTGHLVLGRFHIFVDNATGQLKMSDGPPTSAASGSFVGLQNGL